MTTFWSEGEELEGGAGHLFRVVFVHPRDPRYAIIEWYADNVGGPEPEPRRPSYELAFRDEGDAGTGDWSNPREGRDDRRILVLEEGRELLEVLLALDWQRDRREVQLPKTRERGVITHVYHNFFGQLCVHVRHWDGKLSGIAFDRLEAPG